MLSINQKINNYFAKFLTGLIKHKFIASIVLIVVIGSSYFGYTKIFNNNNAIRYVLVQAQKGALIVSVSGSGQVSATNQVDIKSKAGGDIACINVQDGQEIKVGALIAPNSAIKQRGEMNFVEMPQGSDLDIAMTARKTSNMIGIIFKNSLIRQSIKIGISNDEFTEILSGIKEGDLIVTRIIQSTSAKPQAQQQSSGLKIPGINTGGGGGFRRN